MSKILYLFSAFFILCGLSSFAIADDTNVTQYNKIQEANKATIENTKERYDSSMDVTNDPETVFTYDTDITDSDGYDDDLEDNTTYNDSIIEDDIYRLDGNTRIIID